MEEDKLKGGEHMDLGEKEKTYVDIPELRKMHEFRDSSTEELCSVTLRMGYPVFTKNEGVPLFETANFTLTVPSFDEKDITKSFYKQISKTKKLSKRRKSRLLDILPWIFRLPLEEHVNEILFSHHIDGSYIFHNFPHLCNSNIKEEKLFLIRSQRSNKRVTMNLRLTGEGSVGILEKYTINNNSKNDDNEDEDDDNEDEDEDDDNEVEDELDSTLGKVLERANRIGYKTLGYMALATISLLLLLDNLE